MCSSQRGKADASLGLREDTTDSDCSYGGSSSSTNMDTYFGLPARRLLLQPSQSPELPAPAVPEAVDVHETLGPTLEISGAVVPLPNFREYQLFPTLHEQQPRLPTFADVFGQPMQLCPTIPEDEPAQPVEAGIHSDGNGNFSNIPSTMMTDRFGMTGLLSGLRATRNDPQATQLAIGEDLTTYGLDMAAQGDLYVHFNGPFTQMPLDNSPTSIALQIGTRAVRDAMDKFPHKPPTWDPFVPEVAHLGIFDKDGQQWELDSS